MLEYEIHQNFNFKQIEYLCKLLANKEKTAAVLQAQCSESQTAALEASKFKKDYKKSRKNVC